MRQISDILDELERRHDCVFRPATRLPTLPDGLLLPPDVAAFYRRFSSGRAFGTQSDPRYRFAAPDEFVQIGFTIQGEMTPAGPQRSWFTLADVQDGNCIAIDCHPERLGYCYDAFHETIDDLGRCAVLALSFTEFMNRAAEAGDEAWWLHDRFATYGYADRLSEGTSS